MASLNRVFLMGNLTRDVELRTTPGGVAVGLAGMAVNRKFKDGKGEQREEVTFVDLEMWGKTAEAAAKYVKKGGSLFVEGRLKLDQWEDKTTGQKRSKLKVVVDRMQLLGARPAGAAVPSAPPAAAPAPLGKDLDIAEESVPF